MSIRAKFAVVGVVVVLGFLLCAPCRSQAAAIYSDTFDRGTVVTPVTLAGATPDIGPSAWTASSLWSTNGAALNTNAQTTGTAWLPFTPTSGNIYTITATVTTSDNSTNWGAMGFQTSFDMPTYADQNANAASVHDATLNNSAPWMLVRGSGLIKDFYALNTNDSIPSSTGNTSPSGATNTISIVLDTTSPANWTATYYLNSVNVDSITYGPGHTYANPTIGDVFVSSASEALSFTNFSLTSTSTPEPASVGLLAFASIGLLGRRRPCAR